MARKYVNPNRTAAEPLSGLAAWVDTSAAERFGIAPADVAAVYVRQVLERDPSAAGSLRELLGPAPRPPRARRPDAAASAPKAAAK